MHNHSTDVKQLELARPVTLLLTSSQPDFVPALLFLSLDLPSPNLLIIFLPNFASLLSYFP
jgi:hypothetical protein